MSDIVDTTEMYIKVIYELMEDDVVAMRARIVERLNHSGPTVSQTVARLERDGLLYVDVDRHLKLTDKGMELATQTITKHRFAERLLADTLGFPWELAHDEACKWEHVIGDEVLGYLQNFLNNVSTDPYGNVIPVDGNVYVKGVSLLDAVKDTEKEVEILRIGEPVQVKVDLLKDFSDSGILPNAKVTVKHCGNDYFITGGLADKPVILNKSLARHIFVK